MVTVVAFLGFVTLQNLVLTLAADQPGFRFRPGIQAAAGAGLFCHAGRFRLALFSGPLLPHLNIGDGKVVLVDRHGALDVSRKALDNLVNCRAGVSPEMAVRLATAFGGSA